MFKILIAEDDNEVRLLFQRFLTKNGFAVACANNGKEALDIMSKDFFDLLVSDIMMPVMDGYELVRSLRESGDNTPVLMITAKNAYEDMRLGFLSGTDDYMVKPVNVNEMLLRINALLRRAQMIREKSQTIGSTTLELETFTVIAGGEQIILPQKEFMLLYKMFSYPGKIFTRQQLMDDVWGYNTDSDMHTLDVHIGNLRNKFRNNPDFEIVTMRGVGFKVLKK
ncbi:MAG: response regulator transcription factor [Clostridiales bacterium]|nr:response regulator transcription factor [Clostridiales bacterium]